MKRRLFTITSAFSMLLFVAVVVLWVRSVRTTDDLIWRRLVGMGNRVHFAGLGTVPHGVTLTRGERIVTNTASTGFVWITNPRPAGLAAPTWSQLGFQQYVKDASSPHAGDPFIKVRVVVVPFWFLLLLTALLPLLGVWRLLPHRRKRRRREAGLCPSCGYDLRATPERCPECGYQAATASAG